MVYIDLNWYKGNHANISIKYYNMFTVDSLIPTTLYHYHHIIPARPVFRRPMFPRKWRRCRSGGSTWPLGGNGEPVGAMNAHMIPSGNLTVCYWSHGHRNSWLTKFAHFLAWWFSIVMLVYQRVHSRGNWSSSLFWLPEVLSKVLHSHKLQLGWLDLTGLW